MYNKLERMKTYLDEIKKVFLNPNYDDTLHGYIVEDCIYSLDHLIEELLTDEKYD